MSTSTKDAPLEIRSITGPVDYSMTNPYLDNIIGPIEVLGLSPTVNPLYHHISAQRLMMLSAHLTQTVSLVEPSFPGLFSGIEGHIGEFEHDVTARDQDIEILAVIPRYNNVSGMFTIKGRTPYHTVIYRGDSDNVISYFNYNQYTLRSEGYGYPNKQLAWNRIVPGNMIFKDEKLITSPSHDGAMYMQGCDANVCFLEIKDVSEDAFVVSESLAKRMRSYSYNTVTFRISANAIPLDLYGNGSGEHKIMPDIGEQIRADGILCALRTPTENSIICDTAPENLARPQPLHDEFIYAKPGAEVVDIEVVVNRSCKTKMPDHIFAQLQRYRELTNDYCSKIISVYNRVKAEGRKISDPFNTLVTRCMQNMAIDGVDFPAGTYPREVRQPKFKFKPCSPKEEIEFISVTVVYKYIRDLHRGSKITNRCGGKGTVVAIWPDEWMPVDEQGFRADLIKTAVSVFNRMNPSQIYEQFINRGAELVRRRLVAKIADDPSTAAYLSAFETLVDYANDCNHNWARVLREKHTTPEEQIQYVKETLNDRFYIWMAPGIKHVNLEWVAMMRDKWDIQKSPVTFTVEAPNGELRRVTTKRAVMIGSEYLYLLYKVPHLRCTNLGHINQYHSPGRVNARAKLSYPIPQTANRMGEDEIRNIMMVAGPEVAAYILCLYANSYEGVTELGSHLLFDEVPSQLKDVNTPLRELLQTNDIVRLVQYIFSCFGVNVLPTRREADELISDSDAVNSSEDVEDEGDKADE